jgi:aspartyl protease family protein
MRFVVAFAALAIVAGIAVPRYAAQMSSVRPAPKIAAAQPAAPAAPAEPTSAYSRSVTVPRDEHGHFRIDGYVDGQRVDFMVDTGASVVALTADDAAMLGFHPAESEFTILVKTANGTVHAAPIELGRVEIGDLMLQNVAAMVLPDGALSDNLLGLSFLSRLHFEYGNGTLVLEQ